MGNYGNSDVVERKKSYKPTWVKFKCMLCSG